MAVLSASVTMRANLRRLLLDVEVVAVVVAADRGVVEVTCAPIHVVQCSARMETGEIRTAALCANVINQAMLLSK